MWHYTNVPHLYRQMNGGTALKKIEKPGMARSFYSEVGNVRLRNLTVRFLLTYAGAFASHLLLTQKVVYLFYQKGKQPNIQLLCF